MRNGRNGGKSGHPLLLTYAALWGLSVCLFWLFGRTSCSAAMLYGILVQYILFPILTVAVSLLTALKSDWKIWQWGLPVLLGAAYSTIWLFTFGLANTVSSGNWNPPLMQDILFGGVLSAAGILVGRGLRFLQKCFSRG